MATAAPARWRGAEEEERAEAVHTTCICTCDLVSGAEEKMEMAVVVNARTFSQAFGHPKDN